MGNIIEKVVESGIIGIVRLFSDGNGSSKTEQNFRDYDYIPEPVSRIQYNFNSYQFSKPLNDFRCKSIFPTSDDVHERKVLNLEPNLLKGNYQSVYQYLDIHFNLMREDFFKPLREDIAKFRMDPRSQLNSIKMHKIKALGRGVKQGHICESIEIITDFSTESKDKRFMNGSLVIFSSDNLKTFFCGTVEDSSNINKNQLLVHLKQTIRFKDNFIYLMLECFDFFEPYHNVMKVLQVLPFDEFPMTEYIINTTTFIKSPNYWNGGRPVVNTSDLNPSQAKAVINALTHEFAIVQGPPGTGKTFVGFKIAKTLLSYSSYWNGKGPLLVISQTNHALDTFLEGLLDTTDDILRLGGRTKSKLLQDHNLFNMRRKFNESGRGAISQKAVSVAYGNCKDVEKEISLRMDLDVVKSSIPNLMAFNYLVQKRVVGNDWFSGSEKEFLTWMLEDDGSVTNNPVSLFF